MENKILLEFAQILETLLDDLPYKSKEELKVIIATLKKTELSFEDILKIQDDLEIFSNSNNINSFARNEIMNIISDMELIIQN